MKTKNILKSASAALLSASMLVSCSSDYLEVAPVTSFDTNTITSTIEGCETGYFGLCALMYCQYSNYQAYFSFNGESWFAQYYGDITGQDYFSWLWASHTNTYALNWTSMNNDQSWIPSMGWFYPYTLISGANQILSGIDDYTDSSEDRAFIKAGCLTIRAHAYVRLLQLYAPRWEDSNNGETKCIVMRTTPTVGETPLVTMNAVLKQIYTDLDQAISIYEGAAKNKSRKANWEPNVDVARGIYARAAMLKHDYAVAQDMAHKARAKYPIMTAKQYLGGFAEPNGEWMWNNLASAENIYYWAWGSWYACNGAYPTYWGSGAGAINYDLYKKIPEGDVRQKLFWTPDKEEYFYQGITAAVFWDKNAVNPENMDMNSGMSPRLKSSIEMMNKKSVPDGDINKWGLPNQPSKDEGAASTVVIPFGAQYKFWGLDQFGTSAFPFMRGAEMLLTEAEAAYHNSQPGVAVECLKELNKNRNENYTIAATSGEALLDEIKINRRIELWGEGHSWFDLKRWNEPMQRRAWVAGDMNSNNIPVKYAIERETSAYHGWRYAIPQNETQYNSAIRASELGY